MRLRLLVPILALGAANGYAATLQCDASRRCDAYLKNCVDDSYIFIATVDPIRQAVVMGNTSIKADFSNPAEVSFAFSRYLFRLNRFEYSAILSTDGEVRSGWCKKIDHAW
jgi:hypothetical protein